MPRTFLQNSKELLKINSKISNNSNNNDARNFPLVLPKIASCNYVKLSDCVFLFALKHPSQIYFNGILEIQCIFGSINIFGYILKEFNSKIVYSLLDSSALFIQTVENPKNASNDFTSYTQNKEDLRKIDTLLKQIDYNGCLFTLKPVSSLRYNLEQLFIKNNIYFVPNVVKSANTLSYFNDVEYCLNCVFDFNVGERVQKKLIVDEKWENFIQYLTTNNNGRLMVCGGKGFGKSTMLRYLINRTLNLLPNVVLIDLDIGQPVMNVPNQIACHLVTQPLLGPNFTQLQPPLRSIFIPSVNVEDCMLQYLDALHKLSEMCVQDEALKNAPWIINTMGFSRGIGVLLHKAAVKLLRPTNLLLLNSNLSKFKLQNFKENLFGNENFKNTFNLEYFPNEEFSCNIIETMAPIDLFLQTSHNSDQVSSKQLREALEVVYFGDGCRQYTVHIVEDVNITSSSKNLKKGSIVGLCETVVCRGFGKIVNIRGNLVTLRTPIDIKSMFKKSCLILNSIEKHSIKFKSILRISKVNPTRQSGTKRTFWHQPIIFPNKRLYSTYKLLSVQLY